MENKEFLENRLNGIGGSDAAAILGISPFKSRLQLWHEKVNKVIYTNSKSNLIFEIGHALEPIIANEYSKMTGRKLEVRESKSHSNYPFIIGNIDREIIKSEKNSKGILEIKTKGAWINWEETIPPYYIAQIQHYMAIYEYNWSSFAVLDLGAREITVTDIERDDTLINTIIEEEKKFWDLVQTKTPPTTEPTTTCNSFLKEIYKTSEPITIDISDNTVATEYARNLKYIKEQYKSLDKSELIYKNYFMDLLKNAEKAIGSNYTITWKNDRNSLKFDEEKFKNENQELYKKYLKEKKGVRRFLSKFSME